MATFPADTTAVLTGHGRRIAAALLDAVAFTVVVGACAVAGFAVATTTDGGNGWEALGRVIFGTILGIIVGVVCWLVLMVWLVRRPGPHNGQTIGKQLAGIRAVRTDGAPVGVGLALLREILAKGILVALTASLVSGLLGFIDAGVIGSVVAIAVWYGPALADEQRRALHDRLCSTRVVAAKPVAAAATPTADELWPATR